MALGLMEVIEDAVNLIDSRGSDVEVLRKELQEQRNQDIERFRQSPLPGDAVDLLKGPKQPNADISTDLDIATFYKGANICHISYLPAETRFQGILTEAPVSQQGFFDYYKGIKQENKKVPKLEPDDEMIPLVWQPGLRQKCPYANYDVSGQCFVLPQ